MLRTAGHTHGHVAVELLTRGGGAIFSGDVIHHPIQLDSPNLVQGGDSEPEVARQTRETLLAPCAAEDLLLLTAHFAGDQPFSVRETPAGHLVPGTVPTP
ncbi:MAG: hypothetical protein WKF57_11435 [Nakamurella sp.]